VNPLFELQFNTMKLLQTVFWARSVIRPCQLYDTLFLASIQLLTDFCWRNMNDDRTQQNIHKAKTSN